MTTPTAALAEALDAHVCADAYSTAPIKCGHKCAAAILAALPPDWCGHGAYEAELERNWSRDRAALGATEARENECERELAMLLAVNHAHSAEIARLRAIEEAARALLPEDVKDYGNRWDALRAALEAER